MSMQHEAPTQIVKRKTGRPPIYDPYIAAEILMRLANTEPLTRICMDKHLPHYTTVIEWVIDDVDGFAKRYARARMIAAEAHFEHTLAIADNTSGDFVVYMDKAGNPQVKANHYEINRARLMVDARTWYLAKLYPRKFGEQSEKLAAEGEKAEQEKAERASEEVVPLRPTLTRDEWMAIHGLDKVAAIPPPPK
jgi:hypothetical protein